ncbi:BglG family transcription antiterminator [Vagococcus elongatus]|uniref:PTS system EIIA component n=1 Tax=Vagococcus elongatus TaxID=180344 RepID=A0A430AQ08_9ENTE|nr:BglG family transcription antiterminator [Vagococcus elongatus]RSU10014.1 hypothetical protein CBF29_10600 [Vagococcus elongatus]
MGKFVLNDSQAKIISTLLDNDKPLKVGDIQASTQLSKRSVYNNLKVVNEYFQEIGLSDFSIGKQKKLLLSPEEKEFLKDKLKSNQTDLVLCPEQRVNLIACYLMFPEKRISIESIEKMCRVSRNTIISDIKQTKKELENYQLAIVYSPKMGYRIEGKLINKREVFLFFIERLLKFTNIHLLTFLKFNDVNENFNKLKIISDELDNSYNEESLLALAALLSVIRRGNERYEFSIKELYFIQDTIELAKVDKYFTEFSIHDRFYLTVHLLGTRSAAEFEIDGEKNVELLKLAERIIEKFEVVTNNTLFDKDTLVNEIYLHLSLSLHYHKLSIQAVNPLLEEIKTNYASIYSATKIVCESLKDDFLVPIFESEIANITLHLGSHLREPSEKSFRKKVMIVCPSGQSTSNLLQVEVAKLAPQIEVIGTSAVSDIVDKEQEFDFIISTVELETPFPFIKVNPILTKEDKEKIATVLFLSQSRFQADDKQINGLFDIIGRYVEPREMPAITKEIIDFVNHSNPIIKVEHEYRYSLAELIGQQNIQIVPDSLDWRTGIMMAASPLKESKTIDQEYVDEMIRLVDVYGPYVLLGENVALAHAKPENGVNRLGISMLVCPKGIYFDEENEIKILFVVASPNEYEHLNYLNDILKFAKDSAAVDSIIQTKNVIECYELTKRIF